MVGFKRFGATKKIRSVSLDTNVLSDSVYYTLFGQKGRLKETIRLRFSQSFEALVTLLSFRVDMMGVSVVRKELQQKPTLADIYWAVFDREAGIDREVKQLAQRYQQDVGLEPADAFIVAIASVAKIDLFLSWNRDDVVNNKNLERVQAINRQRGVAFPVFATPREFLERVFATQENTICLSQTPVPLQYRLRPF